MYEVEVMWNQKSRLCLTLFKLSQILISVEIFTKHRFGSLYDCLPCKL